MAQDSSDRFIDETHAAARKQLIDARDKFDFLKNACAAKNTKLAEEASTCATSLDALLRGGQSPAIKTTPNAEDKINIVPIKSELNFSNVAGMTDVKEALRKHVILPAKNPDLCRYYGIKTGVGVLLYGPAGSGKTYFAEAAAGELKRLMLMIEPADCSKYVGESEKYVRAVFKKAGAEGYLVFIDEIDALGQARGDNMQGYERKMAAQFLIELEKFIRNGGIALAATNSPSSVDPAFRRPGRFGREIYVGLPDSESIRQLLAIKANERPALAQSNIDSKELMQYAEGRTAMEICHIIDLACERRIDFGKAEPLTLEDLAYGDMLTPRRAPIWARQERVKLEQNGQIELYPKIIEMAVKYNAAKDNNGNGNKSYA